MYAIDFEYDGRRLSDYNFIVCNFNSSNGADEVSIGSVITFNKISRNGGKKNNLSSTQHNECITATFDICKNPDIFDPDFMEITSDECQDLMRWLNRSEFLKFYVVDDELKNDDPCYFNASFNIKKIKINEKLCGLRLIMETDCDFGYGSEVVKTFEFNGGDDKKSLIDNSYDIGFIYPTVIITAKENGNLELFNEFEQCLTVIKNCIAGETITLNGDVHTIISDCESHNICNDFNYEYFRIGNALENKKNVITASLPCKVVIKYTPIIKDTP